MKHIKIGFMDEPLYLTPEEIIKPLTKDWENPNQTPNFLTGYSPQEIQRFKKARGLEQMGFGIKGFEGKIRGNTKNLQIVIPDNSEQNPLTETKKDNRYYGVFTERELKGMITRAQIDEAKITNRTTQLKLGLEYAEIVREIL